MGGQENKLLIFADDILALVSDPQKSMPPFWILLTIHPSIFYRLIRRSGRGGAGAHPSSLRARGEVHPGQIASPSQTIYC